MTRASSLLTLAAILAVANSACSRDVPTVEQAPATVVPSSERAVGELAPWNVAPQPRVEAAPVTARIEIPPAKPVSKGPKLNGPASTLRVVEATMASSVEARAPLGSDLDFTADGSRVWAWVSVQNRDEPTTVDMIWKRDGEKINTVTLKVGLSRGWRTWSYRTLRGWDVGHWSVEVVDAEGNLLRELRFDVHKPVTVARRD